MFKKTARPVVDETEINPHAEAAAWNRVLRAAEAVESASGALHESLKAQLAEMQAAPARGIRSVEPKGVARPSDKSQKK